MITAILALVAVSVLLQVFLIFRPSGREFLQFDHRFDGVEKASERLEREIRAELDKVRSENLEHSRHDREELAAALTRFNEVIVKSVQALTSGQKDQLERLTETNERKLEHLRATIDERVRLLQEDNGKRLEQMRATVDEKLQGTLEKRLGDSFKLVSERLELVHKGLGEMQGLAVGVGDLKRVLTNVKTRGIWGEVQLEALLSEVLTNNQYEKNAKTNPLSDELVEFVIKLPGQGYGAGEVLLPIDSKYPVEDYQRMLEAQESADPKALEDARKGLERSIKSFAKDICTKYLHPPQTTDFAIMFLPIEGLYAEVVRCNGLLETLQRDHRVVLSGPATFAAFLNSLQMGFRTVSIEKRSSEVWKLLSAVKTEFGKFTDVLEAVKKKLELASSSMEQATTRSRAIQRKLREVEELPAGQTAALLPDLVSEPDDNPEVQAANRP